MIAEYRQALRLFSRNVRLYLLFGVFAGLFFYGIHAVLLNLFLLRLGYGLERIGLVNAVAGASMLACSVPAGVWGTRCGPRQALVAGGILYAFGLGAYPLAMFVPLDLRTAWLLVTLVLGRAGVTLVYVNASPFLMDATGPRERAHVFSVLMALLPLSGFAGSLLGGVLPGFLATAMRVTLDDPAPYGYALLAGAALSLPGAAALLATSDPRTCVAQEAKHAPGPTADAQPLLRSGTQAVPYGLMGVMALVALLQMVGQGAAGTYSNVYLDAKLGAPTTLIGTLSAAGRLLAGFTPLVVPLLMVRWGSNRTTVWGILGAALSLLPMALIPHWLGAGLGLAGAAALGGIAGTAYNIYTNESVTPQWRPMMQAGITMAQGAGGAIVAYVGGYLIQAWGYPAFFAIGGGLTAAGAALLAAHARVRREQRAHAPA